MSSPELSIGAYGEDVRQLQASLLQAGYHIPAPEAARGFFGPATRQAVQRWQARNRLPATGVAETQAAAALIAPTTEADVPPPRPAAPADPERVVPAMPLPAARESVSAAVTIPPGPWGVFHAPPAVFVDCSVDAPASNEAVTGAEPGFQLTVTGTASAVASDGLTTLALIPSLQVLVDGRSFEAVPGEDNTWSAQTRVYRSGTVPISVTAEAEITINNTMYTNDHTAGTQVQVTLGSDVPSMVVNAPLGGTIVRLGENGADVPVSVTMADASKFGEHTVVVQVDHAAPLSLPLSAGSTTQYTGMVHLTALPLAHALWITRTCAGTTVAATELVALVGVDAGPPHVTVSHPAQPYGPVAAQASQDGPAAYTVSVSGTAYDTQSGMAGGQAAIAVSLQADGPRTAARPEHPGDWTAWTVDDLPLATAPSGPGVRPGSLGTFQLFVWATDPAGNTTRLDWGFEAITSWVPRNLDERLSLLAYLRDLIQFTCDHVSSGTGSQVSPHMLAAVLGQPIDTISQPPNPAAAAAQVPINELRVPIEIVRTYMADQHITPSTAGMAAYLSMAYGMSLAGLGTSYAELRLTRGADPSERSALAARIGIPLHRLAAGSPGTAPSDRPDQLDALTLDGPALTEQALQDLFGLTPTTPFDPQPQPPPQLLLWQEQAQRNFWQSEDTRAVIVDPDIITAADVRSDGRQYNQVLDLLDARAAELTTQSNELDAARRAAASDADGGLSALLAAGLPPSVDIAALRKQDAQGTDIQAELAAAGLDRSGFEYLVQLQRLCASGGALVTASEWADAVDVLVGSCRRRQYATWAAPDPATGKTAEDGILLSPETFQVTNDPPPAGPLRISPAARRDWQATLRTRTLQRQSLEEAMSELAAAAEQAALPVLRDALLAGIAGPKGDPATAGEQITSQYQIDVRVSGALTTTRLEQAITSLQTLLLLVRSGDNARIDPVTSWTLNIANAEFDSAWAWIGTLSSWQSATTTFLFPEAALDPSLLDPGPGTGVWWGGPTPPYSKLREALAAGPGVDVSGPVSDYLNGSPDSTPPVPGARQVLQDILGPAAQDFDYPKTHSKDTQAALAKMSGKLEPVPSNPALLVFWAAPMLIAQRLHADGHYQAALDWLWMLFPYTDNKTDNKTASAYDVINNELAVDAAHPDLTLTGWTAFDPFTLINGRPYPHLRATLLAIISCLLDYADSEFATETDESIGHARNLYRTAAALLGHPKLQPVTPSSPGEAGLPIPQLAVLQGRAGNQLTKLRQDRNIAGLPRTRAVSSGDPIRQPTPYRFKVLLARAQQLAQQATSLEGEYLTALEKYDNKTLQLADAQNAAAVAAAQLTVHEAQVQQATDAVAAAQAQQAKAAGAVSTLSANITAAPNQYEQNLMDNYSDMRNAQDVIATGEFVSSIGQAAASVSAPWQIAGAVLEYAGATVKFGGQIWLNEIQKSMQENQLRASIENRKQEWQIQLASAQQDVLVAAAQVKTANDQVTIAQAEQTVAGLQADQAKATLDLLASQFTSPGMYKWLSDTLGGVYRYFLQQATATARLAQAQLAFERAEPARVLIRSDYWQPLTAPPGGDARGLTGAERLAEDLSKLDQYAFSSDSRRLNVTQTLSLAALAPVEFLDFRATGQISFTTPTALFDRDFPGHYQRLIRQVRLSVVALVPPARGIRATLASYGISRVTTAASGMFSEVLLRRDPSVVALTSPVDATGVFTADLQPDMLLPFEGSGVDTTWELTLPRAANPFDFRTISDVLLTIDYTALLDLDYQAQVIRRLNADLTRSGDQVFSLARDFPDQWYTLNNPDPSTHARAATLTLRDIDFPPNMTGLATAQIAVRLSGSGPFPPIPITLTRGTDSGTAGTDPLGIASTRRGGAEWNQFIGHPPAGDWQLSFDPAADPLFTPGGLDDVLLVIGWTGQAPAWPA
jgi:peptidoglycan hydrolase-like protein with peptidoglycan-binding domain